MYENNKTLFVIAQAGDTYKKIAKAVQLSERNLLKYNDLESFEELKEGQVVYIEKKRNSKRGTSHKVTNEHETLQYISQVYGVSLASICKINALQPNANLVVGDRVKLSH